MLESKVQRDSIDYAESRGWYCFKVHKSNRRGVIDYICVRDGVVLFVEFKKPGEKPRRQQRKRHRELEAHGGRVYSIDNAGDAYAVFC